MGPVGFQDVNGDVFIQTLGTHLIISYSKAQPYLVLVSVLLHQLTACAATFLSLPRKPTFHPHPVHHIHIHTHVHIHTHAHIYIRVRILHVSHTRQLTRDGAHAHRVHAERTTLSPGGQVNIGVITSIGGSQCPAHATGKSRARVLWLMGRMWSVQEAALWGITRDSGMVVCVFLPYYCLGTHLNIS